MKYEKKVIEWARERGILDFSDTPTQLQKAVEEVFETMEAFYKMDREQLKLELGDILVTLVLACNLSDFDTDECLEATYNKIKDRKGKMKNGFFVKEA